MQIRRKKFPIKKIVIFAGLFLLIFVGIKGTRYLPFFYQLTFNKNIELKKTNNRINILVLGIGGGSHDGPNLTDTILFASVDQKAHKISLISIPRDLWMPDLNEKINTAYAIGQSKGSGKGLVLAKAAVGEVLHQDIDYAVRIDFAGFVNAVDQIGGLDISVDNTFDDYQYPIEEKREDLCGHTLDETTALLASGSAQEVFPCRYEHLHFDKDMQHMDGERVLKFVRSRYADGVEGSDFARSKRQGKVIAAFKEKIFSAQTILNPAKVLSLYSILKDSIDTDIKQDEMDDFIRLAEKEKSAEIESFVIDSGDETTNRPGILVNPQTDAEHSYSWFLAPRIGDDNFTEIKQYVACLLSYKECIIGKTYAKDKFGSKKN